MSDTSDKREMFERLYHPEEAELFIEVDDDFINNSFNLFGIRKKVGNFNDAYEYIKRRDHGLDQMFVEDARRVYGLLHARFLLTRQGLEKMKLKYDDNKSLPQCPRVYCKGCKCLPYGIYEEFGREKVKFFCPSCCDIYNPEKQAHMKIDGSYFGPSWVHIFLQKYANVLTYNENQRVYVPKIFGFRIFHDVDSYDSYEESTNDQ